ncbi:MAG: hypothetical protein HYY24_16885 [Verrucomicrobia bacterium]|nr:hypothetical protein [Verrucomicrobiota bacterium]
MKLGSAAFNLYLISGLACLPLGCKSAGEAKPGKELSILRLHLEVNPDGTQRNRPVPIYRAKPEMVNVNVEPFIDERSVTNAAVLDELGSFALGVEFDWHGTLALEQATTAFKDSRMAVFGQWSDGKKVETRWLGAPKVSHSITNGAFIFTPDATREESELIVRGLKNLAVQLGNAPKPKKKSK